MEDKRRQQENTAGEHGRRAVCEHASRYRERAGVPKPDLPPAPMGRRQGGANSHREPRSTRRKQELGPTPNERQVGDQPPAVRERRVRSPDRDQRRREEKRERRAARSAGRVEAGATTRPPTASRLVRLRRSSDVPRQAPHPLTRCAARRRTSAFFVCQLFTGVSLVAGMARRGWAGEPAPDTPADGRPAGAASFGAPRATVPSLAIGRVTPSPRSSWASHRPRARAERAAEGKRHHASRRGRPRPRRTPSLKRSDERCGRRPRSRRARRAHRGAQAPKWRVR